VSLTHTVMNLKLWEKEQGSLHPPSPILRLDTTRRLLLLLHAMSPAMGTHNKMLLNAKSSRANAFQRWRMQRFVSNDDAMGVAQLLQHLFFFFFFFFFFFLPTKLNLDQDVRFHQQLKTPGSLELLEKATDRYYALARSPNHSNNNYNNNSNSSNLPGHVGKILIRTN
jgi:hypothetical protein